MDFYYYNLELFYFILIGNGWYGRQLGWLRFKYSKILIFFFASQKYKCISIIVGRLQNKNYTYDSGFNRLFCF